MLLPPEFELAGKITATTKNGVKEINLCDRLVN